jgi:hypothetical protein
VLCMEEMVRALELAAHACRVLVRGLKLAAHACRVLVHRAAFENMVLALAH